MNCQEAQSNIMNYVNHHLSSEETREFIEHIRCCPNCQDELEINYIVMVGLQQLDEGEVLSMDFRKELQEDLEQRFQKTVEEEERIHSRRIAALALVISLSMWLLGKAITFLV